MLELPIYDRSIIDTFYKIIDDDFADMIYQKIQKSKIQSNVKGYLTKNIISEILFSTPERLLEIQKEYIQSINNKSTLIDYENFLLAKDKKKRSSIDNKLINRFNPTNKKLIEIFNYDHYISSKKTSSYALAKIVGRNTCTYCNRLYTFTVIRKDVNSKRINNGTRITRPQFDHWFPKKKFPLFSLSFYNLIPSCSVCNSSVKSEESFMPSTHLHPYIKEKNDKYRFSYILEPDGSPKVILHTHGDKAKKTAEDLKILEIYSEHSEYELKDLLELRFKYSDNYLDVLFNDTFNLDEVDKKDSYRLLFGVEIDPNDFHKRPFSKFKYDILKELKVIR